MVLFIGLGLLTEMNFCNVSVSMKIEILTDAVIVTSFLN